MKDKRLSPAFLGISIVSGFIGGFIISGDPPYDEYENADIFLGSLFAITIVVHYSLSTLREIPQRGPALPEWRRHTGVAALLSAFVPGSGNWYAGDRTGAIVNLVAPCATIFGARFLVRTLDRAGWEWVATWIFGLAICIVVMLYIFQIGDAYRTAKR